MDKNKSYTVEVKCLFCEATLKKGKHDEYKSGDLIECSNCGEKNDYDAVLEVAKEKGIERVKAEVAKDIQKQFKNMFKKF